MARLPHTTLEHLDALSIEWGKDGALWVRTWLTTAQWDQGAGTGLSEAIAAYLGPGRMWHIILAD